VHLFLVLHGGQVVGDGLELLVDLLELLVIALGQLSSLSHQRLMADDARCARAYVSVCELATSAMA
jgi:hypothetical protein